MHISGLRTGPHTRSVTLGPDQNRTTSTKTDHPFKSCPVCITKYHQQHKWLFLFARNVRQHCCSHFHILHAMCFSKVDIKFLILIYLDTVESYLWWEDDTVWCPNINNNIIHQACFQYAKLRNSWNCQPCLEKTKKIINNTINCKEM